MPCMKNGTATKVYLVDESVRDCSSMELEHVRMRISLRIRVHVKA